MVALVLTMLAGNQNPVCDVLNGTEKVDKGDKQSEELLEQIKEYMQLTTDLVLEEQEAALAELQRMENILNEAATQLRDSFTEIDNLIGEGLSGLLRDGAMAQAGSDNHRPVQSIKSRLSDQYRSSITALQFEDIVKQIIGHSRTRGQGIDEILRNIKARIESLNLSEWSEDALEQAISGSRKDIEVFRDKMAATNPVAQQSLKTGEIELF
jgi:hypothetical protein